VRKRWLRANSNSFNKQVFGDSSKCSERRLANRQLSIASNLRAGSNRTPRVSEQAIEPNARRKIFRARSPR